jgi:predicted transcriptional regulator
MSDADLTIHVGSLEDMGERFIAAWDAGETGQESGRHLTFPNLEGLLSTLSPKRLALMRALRKAGPMSVRALSGLVGRDYKSVHGDVAMLVAAGLLERPERDRVAAPWDRIISEISLAA